jgi:hypothetical protein
MSGAFVLKAPVRWWKCPSCDKVDRTQNPDMSAVQFHNCPALAGMSIPLVEVKDPDAKARARQVAVESEYGYQTAAVRTERLDGSNDTTVFPGAAQARSDT